jgi:hypothetical protein
MSRTADAGRAPRSRLAHRHAALCEASVSLPDSPDWTWADVAALNAQHVIGAACLFDLMASAQAPREHLASREHDTAIDERWALSVAAIQPFERLCCWTSGPQEASAVRGMLEIRPRMELAWPGLWRRCLQDWPLALAHDVVEAAERTHCRPGVEPLPSARRAARAWSQCLRRVAATGVMA